MTGGQEPNFPFRLLGMGAEISFMPCLFCDVLFDDSEIRGDFHASLCPLPVWVLLRKRAKEKFGL